MSLSVRPPNRGHCSPPFEWLIITEPSAAFVSGTDFRNLTSYLYRGFWVVLRHTAKMFHALGRIVVEFETSRRRRFGVQLAIKNWQ